MEQTLHDLGGLMLKAVPTIILLIVVYFYLKSMLFTPLEKVLRERDALTAGARKGAQESLDGAGRKEQEYERKFAEARAEVYKAQEETRRKWLEDQAAQVGEERTRMEARVRAEKERIATEAASARTSLTIPSAELASEIADTVLARKAGGAA
jgi:F-type H+-transporting ATPase subunit b